MRHRKKIKEASFNLQKLEECFRDGSGEYEIYLNNFLSSAQSVVYVLNKSFNDKLGYMSWQKKRSERLPPQAKVFKELRNISLKEGPVENTASFLGLDFGKAGIVVPPYAEVIGPTIDLETGKISSYECIIRTKDGLETKVQPVVVHDFTIAVESGGKVYRLEAVISQAKEYLDSLQVEIDETERLFLV